VLEISALEGLQKEGGLIGIGGVREQIERGRRRGEGREGDPSRLYEKVAEGSWFIVRSD
jgi:hypothetical protein